MSPDLYTVIASILAVVFVFLFAVEKFSKQIQRLVGEKFKRFLEKSTNTPVKGVVAGTFITSILQSSTSMSVLLVSLVESSLLPLTNALGVIIGANIGTTITSQLIAFKLLNIAPYILIARFFLSKIKTRYQYLGKTIFYFGLIFSCMFTLSVITGVFSDNETLMNLLSHTSNLFTAIVFGFILVNIFQSSAVTTGVVVILAGQGFLDFEQAFGIILGSNIGTTTTAILASLVTGSQGKRVAMAHFLFNFVGVIIFIPFIRKFAEIIQGLPIPIEGQVAVSHLIFNVVIAIIFVIFFKYYKKMVYTLVP